MTNHHRQSKAVAPPKSVPLDSEPEGLRGAQRTERWRDGGQPGYRRFLTRRARLIRRAAIGIAALVALVTLGCASLWWRLASGPIQLDIVTPWLAAAIAENFGNRHHVQVGGTQIERAENGATAVRIRDIVVRDADGTVVASAPKAEVRVSGLSLLSGHMRAESLNLVGAQMAVRIERDGGVTVFAGTDKRPIATASRPAPAPVPAERPDAASPATAAMIAPPAAAAPATMPPAATSPPPQRTSDTLVALFAWIDGIGETGLDGHDLSELGLKNGTLAVDDERTGKHWVFKDISVSARRWHGGVKLSVGSDSRERPWTVTAAVTPTSKGLRRIEIEAHRISLNDLLLASRLGDGKLEADMPLSASISGEIGPDGTPQSLSGRIVADAGSIGDANDADGRLVFDRVEARLNWDAANRVLAVPFQVVSGGNRITLMGRVDGPEKAGGVWSFKVGGGTILLTSPRAPGRPLILNRIAVTGRYDASSRRFFVDEGDVGNADLSVAFSGNMDFFGSETRLAAGFAGTRMPVESARLLWPVFVSPKVRDWFNEHLSGGTLDHIVIAVNAPLDKLKASGPPVPDDGLSLDAVASGATIRPADGLPALREADLDVHIVGRDAVVKLGKATADLPSGRKLVMTSGTFEVPDTAPRDPPARVRFKLEGPLPAVAELLRMDRLRAVSETPFDPSTIHGNLSAAVTLAMPLKADLPPGSTTYSITADATNFAADRMIMGQKVEAATLHAVATAQGFQLKGDVKIGGSPATLEYRKSRGDPEAEIRIEGALDDTGRSNLGLDLGNSVSGAVPVRLAGQIAASSDREGRFAVEADLTAAQIEGLLPGWTKPSGKPARATFTLTTKPQSIRIDDLVIEGAGGGVKGAVEFDGSAKLQTASFAPYGFSGGDRASLKVERAGDGALRVIMRGDVYDARDFIKAASGVTPSSSSTKRGTDVDLDIKLGAVVGFNGEALRSLDLKMSRRGGELRSFNLAARIGRDARLAGDLRARPGGRHVVHLDSNDAGAFFRFADIYARMTGGEMSIVMDPPPATNVAQEGVLNVRDFAVHDEMELSRALANAPQARRSSIQFSSMRIEFSRMPGRVALRDGVVRGPLIGGTIDGLVHYARDEVHLRGTLVPLYGPNNLLGQLPVVGLFFGGQKEGLVGITYEVVGRPGNPVLRINPISALAPGLLRKVFEFPAAEDSSLQGDGR